MFRKGFRWDYMPFLAGPAAVTGAGSDSNERREIFARSCSACIAVPRMLARHISSLGFRAAILLLAVIADSTMNTCLLGLPPSLDLVLDWRPSAVSLFTQALR